MRIRFRRSVERSLAAITALMLWFGNPSAADKERWDSVSGLALQAFFADKQFADGVHFA